LALLRQVVEELVVPDAVYGDLVVKGRGKPGADEVAESTWIRRESVWNRDAVAHFPPVLGQGEREAIVLAEEHDATLLTDDRRAREVAEERGIAVVGVLWVLGEAKRRGFVSEVRPIIDELLAIGYRLHPERVIRPFLEGMGEAASSE
jgi:predicted nucleic acid-binding protein